MRTISLTKGYFTKVDDEDYEKFSIYKWQASVQVKNGVKKVRAMRSKTIEKKKRGIILSREIMFAPDNKVVDHINEDTLDNRKINLRVCTHSENMMNRGKQNNNTSGYKGVIWAKRHKKWAVDIWINHKNKRIGYFDSKINAAKAYDIMAIKHYGEFANLNIKPERAIISYRETNRSR